MTYMNSDPREMLFFDERGAFDLSGANSGVYAGGGSGGAQGFSTIGRVELKSIEPPNAIHVRNK